MISSKFHEHSKITDQFESADRKKVTVTSPNPFGGTTTVVLTDTSGDTGGDLFEKTLDDTETLGAHHADLEDDFVFNDQVGEQDTATDNLRIVIRTLGLVGVGDRADLTEVITLRGTTSTTQGETDTGTEEDASGADTEADTDTIVDRVGHDLRLEVTRSGTETRTLPDGTVIVDEIHTDDTDHIRDSRDDRTKDKHFELPAVNRPAAEKGDDVLIDDKYVVEDEYAALGDSESQTVTIPVAGGTLTLTSSTLLNESGVSREQDEEVVHHDTVFPLRDTETDTAGVTNNDSGTETVRHSFRLLTTDPATGFKTDINGWDREFDNFTDFLDDDESLSRNSGPAGPARETGTSRTTDVFDNTSGLTVSLHGSPRAGVTIDVDQTLSAEDIGVDRDNIRIDPAAIDPAHAAAPRVANGENAAGPVNGEHETDNFVHHDHLTETGHGTSVVKYTHNTDDGAGNTVQFTETDRDTNTFDEHLDDTDTGEEDLDILPGQPPTDTEHDTDTVIGGATLTDHASSVVSLNITTLDPATGLRTTYTLTDNSTDDLTETETEDVTDNHTNSLSGTDKITGTDDLTEHEHIHDQRTQTVTIVGTDAQGNPIHLQQTSTVTEDETDDVTDDDVQSPNGTNTETSDVQKTQDEQTTNTLTGTYSTIDPLTGVKTTITLNDTITDTLHDHEDDGDTRTKPANGTAIDTPTMTENGTDTVRLQIHDTISQTNADGSPVCTPQTVNEDLSDAESSLNGAITDQGLVDNSASTANGANPQNAPPAGGQNGGQQNNSGESVLKIQLKILGLQNSIDVVTRKMQAVQTQIDLIAGNAVLSGRRRLSSYDQEKMTNLKANVTYSENLIADFQAAIAVEQAKLPQLLRPLDVPLLQPLGAPRQVDGGNASIAQIVDAEVMAALAIASYEGTPLSDSMKQKGWKVADRFPVENTGFYAVLFLNKVTGQAVLGFEGTVPNGQFLKDGVVADGGQGLGFVTGQYDEAIRLAGKLKQEYPNLRLTGHSLGGGLASAAAIVHRIPETVTFNAAGVHPWTVERYKMSLGDAPGLITAFRTRFCPLSQAQDAPWWTIFVYPLVGAVGAVMPDGVGTTHWVNGPSMDLAGGHGMPHMLEGLSRARQKLPVEKPHVPPIRFDVRGFMIR